MGFKFTDTDKHLQSYHSGPMEFPDELGNLSIWAQFQPRALRQMTRFASEKDESSSASAFAANSLSKFPTSAVNASSPSLAIDDLFDLGLHKP